MINVEQYRSHVDGTDWSPAIKRASLAAQQERDDELWLPSKMCICKNTIQFSTGIRLVGRGAVGANIGQGTLLVADFDNGPILHWNGAKDYYGTGGGLRNLNICKAKGRKGGHAVLLNGTAGKNRAGHWVADTVNIYSGEDAGNFEVGI